MSKEERKLRISEHGDYCAVDLYEGENCVAVNYIYLPKGARKKLLSYDSEDRVWLHTEVVFDGERLQCKDAEGYEWPTECKELEDDKIFGLIR